MTSALQAFADAGLWPGLRRNAALALADAGIAGPGDVTKAALSGLPGVSPVQAERLLAAFEKSAEAYDVVEVLVGAGVNPRLAGQAVRAVGAGAAQALRDDPWRLLDAEGATLAEADALARSLGVGTGEQRGRALVGLRLRTAARDGHTALPASVVAEALRSARADVETALTAAVEAGRVFLDENEDETGEPRPGGPLLALERYAMAEDAVANGIARLLATAEPLGASRGDMPEDDDTPMLGDDDTPGGGADTDGPREAGGRDVLAGLDGTQRAAVARALEHGVSLLTGGPGTGKSRTVAAVVGAAAEAGARVALAAPTGRAAKRLEELVGGEHQATTLHRLLGAQGTTGEFARGEAWPLDADLVVVDEASMLDAELAAALVSACADGTHLLLVGDPAQLPSIGAGRVLGDLVDVAAASGAAGGGGARLVNTALTKLYRQAEGGAIARLATAVRGGELPSPPAPEEIAYEVVVVPVRRSEDAATRVVQLVTEAIPRRLGIASGDVQVVTPVHKGPAGTQALNAALKQALNPGDGSPGFDAGDRVVATANRLDLEDGRGFANGEVGVVTETGEGTVTVAFPGGPVTVPSQASSDLTLGWAITVHRAQGSEWPAVVVVVSPEAGQMLSRPLVYTALTRAERHLSVVTAAGPNLARAVAEASARPRVTRLTALLKEELEALSDEI